MPDDDYNAVDMEKTYRRAEGASMEEKDELKTSVSNKWAIIIPTALCFSDNGDNKSKTD